MVSSNTRFFTWIGPLFVITLSLVAEPLVGTSSAEEGCVRTGPRCQRRDIYGCCIGEVAPPSKVEPIPTPRPRCPAGQHRSSGHCCSNGQEWVKTERRCTSPSHRTCPEGRHLSAGHCCAAGEQWVPSLDRCHCTDEAICGPVSPTPPQPELARLQVTSEPAGATILIDGESAGLAPISVRLEPGAHTIEAQLEGYVTVMERLTLTPDGDQRIQLMLEEREVSPEEPVSPTPPEVGSEDPSSEPPRGIGAGPWIVLGAGLAVALTGSVLETVAFHEAEPPEQFDSMTELEAWQDRVADLSLSGYVLLGMGSAALVAGLIWALVRRNRFRGDSESARVRFDAAFVLSASPSVVGRISF